LLVTFLVLILGNPFGLILILLLFLILWPSRDDRYIIKHHANAVCEQVNYNSKLEEILINENAIGSKSKVKKF